MPKHTVQMQWNDAAIWKHCCDVKKQLFICPAEDWWSRRNNDLSDAVELAVGMKIIVTANIEMDLNITNEARGKIVDMILHPDEPPLSNDSIVTLEHLPSYILIKMQ